MKLRGEYRTSIRCRQRRAARKEETKRRSRAAALPSPAASTSQVETPDNQNARNFAPVLFGIALRYQCNRQSSPPTNVASVTLTNRARGPSSTFGFGLPQLQLSRPSTTEIGNRARTNDESHHTQGHPQHNTARTPREEGPRPANDHAPLCSTLMHAFGLRGLRLPQFRSFEGPQDPRPTHDPSSSA